MNALKYWAIGLVVLVVVLFFVLKRPKMSSMTQPGIEYLDITFDITPPNIENYIIEKYTTSDDEMSKYITFNVRWDSKGGFDEIQRLNIKCTNGTAGTSYEKILTKAEDGDYFKMFSTHSVRFSATDTEYIAASMNFIGKISFEIYYSKESSGVTWSEFSSVTNFNPIDISGDAVAVALEKGKAVSQSFNPVISTTLGNSNPIIASFKDNGVFFAPNNSTQYSLNSLLFNSFNRKIEILQVAVDASSETLDHVILRKQKKDDGEADEYIGIEMVGFKNNTNIIKTTDKAKATKFSIIKPKNTEEDFVIFGQINAGILVNVLTVENQIVKLYNYESIVTEDVYKSMRMYFRDTEGLEDKDCVFSVISTTACNEISGTLDSIHSYNAGDKVVKYKQTQERFGQGVCKLPDGTDTTNSSLSKNIVGNDTFYYKTDPCVFDCTYKTKEPSLINNACSQKPSCWKTAGKAEIKLTETENFTTIGPFNGGTACSGVASPPPNICPGRTQCNYCDYAESSGDCDTTTTTSKQYRQKKIFDHTKNETSTCIKPTPKAFEWNNVSSEVCQASCLDATYTTTSNKSTACSVSDSPYTGPEPTAPSYSITKTRNAKPSGEVRDFCDNSPQTKSETGTCVCRTQTFKTPGGTYYKFICER